jgi:hypothetical protein
MAPSGTIFSLVSGNQFAENSKSPQGRCESVNVCSPVAGSFQEGERRGGSKTGHRPSERLNSDPRLITPFSGGYGNS